MIITKKDSLHFRSYSELAFISLLKKEDDAADLNFNQAIHIFMTEGDKPLRKESHRIFNINDLLMVRLAYARFLNKNSAFERSKIAIPLCDTTIEIVVSEIANVKKIY
ncbi:hypothetical protein ACFOET_08150 [Parapedobacter deserti]|uniref:Uncharacterized protein n=1 Tax=Parapedobacter deserti TaxID=1912957 RepID=A0ABV7JHK8_9SPHI